MVLQERDEPVSRCGAGIDRFAMWSTEKCGIRAVVEVRGGQDLGQCGKRTEVGVVALAFCGEQGVQGVVEVIVPLGIKSVAAGCPRRDERGVVQVGLRDQAQRQVNLRRQGGNLVSKFGENVRGRSVNQGVHGV
jgi:hypothetical protein